MTQGFGRQNRGLGAALLLGCAFVACLSGLPGDASADEGRPPAGETLPSLDWRHIELAAEDIRLDEERPDLQQVGEALFRSGFALHSADADFGGFSGLLIEGERLLAVSDQGHWWRATLRFDDSGRLMGLVDSEMAPLADLDGRPVAGRLRRDAEELAQVGDGLLVAFEGEHRMHHYRYGGDPQPRPGPALDGMSLASENAGMEAVTCVLGGRLLVVSEDSRDDEGNLLAWLSDEPAAAWRQLSVAAEPEFMATAAATRPDGGVLLLQRFYSPELGVRVRLLSLAAADLERAASDGGTVVGRELARFQPPLSVDNFEALDIARGPGDVLYAYVLADDNYRQEQRTLLIQLELPKD